MYLYIINIINFLVKSGLKQKIIVIERGLNLKNLFYLFDLEIIIVATIANNNITLKTINKIAPYVYNP